MALWSEPVIDRTESDVARAKYMLERGWANLKPSEQIEWRVGLKGALNTKDLNRIENNVQVISDVLELSLETHADSVPEFATDTYFANLLSNLDVIKTTIKAHSDTPAVPVEPINTYQKVNDVEKILSDIYEILCSNFHYYSGEIYAGDSIGYLL